MNKNFTPGENRNFVSKISDFFKILLALPADLISAGIIAIAQNSNFQQTGRYLKTLISNSYFNAQYNIGLAKPVVIPLYSKFLKVNKTACCFTTNKK